MYTEILLFLLLAGAAAMVVLIVLYAKNNSYSLEDMFTLVINPTTIKEKNKTITMLKNNLLVSNDYTDQIDAEAHTDAIKKYCAAKGLDYDEKNNTCAYNSSTCNGKYDEISDLTYVRDKCLKRSNIIPSLICKDNGFAYKEADVDCTDEGVCTVVKAETCVITPDYCQSKEVDYRTDDMGNGDCYTNDPQIFLQVIFGQTVIKKYRANAENMVKSCSYNPVSKSCAAGIALFVFTPQFILADASKAYAIATYREVVDSCSNVHSSKEVGLCMKSITDRLPWIWLGTEAGVVVDNLLGLIPGYPKNAMFVSKFVNALLTLGTVGPAFLIEYGLIYGPDFLDLVAVNGGKVIGYIQDFGPEAYNAMKKWGGVAVTAIGKYGGIAVKAIVKWGDKIGSAGVGYISKYGSYAVDDIEKYGGIGVDYLHENIFNASTGDAIVSAATTVGSSVRSFFHL